MLPSTRFGMRRARSAPSLVAPLVGIPLLLLFGAAVLGPPLVAQSGPRLSQRRLPDSHIPPSLAPQHRTPSWRGSMSIRRSRDWVDTAWFETSLGWRRQSPALPLLANHLDHSERSNERAHSVLVQPMHHTRRLRPERVYADQWLTYVRTDEMESTAFSQMWRFALFSRLHPRVATVQSQSQNVRSFVFLPRPAPEPFPWDVEGPGGGISLHTPNPATDATLELRPTPVAFMISGRCSGVGIYALNSWGNLNGNTVSTAIDGVKCLTTSPVAERQIGSNAASAMITLGRTLPGVPGWVSWAVQSLTVASVVFDTTGRLDQEQFAFERRELSEPSNANVNPNPEARRDRTSGQDHWFVALHRTANLETRLSTPYGRSQGSRHAGGAILGASPGDLWSRPEHYGRSTLFFHQRTAQRVTATLSSR